MALDDLDLEQWRDLDDRDAGRLADRIASRADAEPVETGWRPGPAGPVRYVLFRRDGELYGLVPGGGVEVGYDGARFVPSEGQLASYASSYEEYGAPGEDYGLPADIRETVDTLTSPPRAVDVPPLLVAVEARDAGLTRVAPDHPLIAEAAAMHRADPREDRAAEPREVRVMWPPGKHAARQARVLLTPDGTVTEAWLMFSLADDLERMASKGMRLLTPDEWEHACGAGAATLFRWGDDCPADRYPGATMRGDGSVEPDHGPHLEPNAFGLNIGQRSTLREATADPAVLCGGDGGSAVCGGSGFFLGWLPLATSYRDGAEGPTANEARDVLVRPAIPLH
ncbi:hypothetical protein [Actinomadura rugatobispora]|uniref:Sulfatase-modifying factor enzyme domain-containing protein n=1 Tax=Actinomadura rugatobispora TaxID=1994 RepID=A0ABW1A7Q8_9ACTN|nr:hypothetical protein GCM10010200_046030 [Actinomadura rugatobispora]